MNYTLKAVYRSGVFVPELPCNLPEETEVELSIQGPLSISPVVTDPRERARVLEQLTENMKRNPLPAEAPRYTREQLHERG